jgi:hypothetical protein
MSEISSSLSSSRISASAWSSSSARTSVVYDFRNVGRMQLLKKLWELLPEFSFYAEINLLFGAVDIRHGYIPLKIPKIIDSVSRKTKVFAFSIFECRNFD